jgi:hypothetical protein
MIKLTIEQEIEDLEVVEDGTVSDVQIMRSNAGYYIGTEYYEADFGTWFPHNRLSGYFKTRELAQKELDFHNFCEKTSQ